MGRPKGSGVQPVSVLFWRHVEQRGLDECWPWTGATITSRGGLLYGKFRVPAGSLECERASTRLAHRVAFRLVQGHWPDPQALHGCDFTLCCNAENPGHIHAGTAAQNTAEMFERGRGHVPSARMGADAPRSKLSDDQAREVIERYAAGDISQDSLAAEYGVSQHAISYTVRGKRRSLQ